MSAFAAGSAALTRSTFLADGTDVGDETHKAGPIAILVIAILCIACFLLFRSMSKHLRNVREDYPVAAPPAEDLAPPTVSTGPAVTHAVPKSRANTVDDPPSD